MPPKKAQDKKPRLLSIMSSSYMNANGDGQATYIERSDDDNVCKGQFIQWKSGKVIANKCINSCKEIATLQEDKPKKRKPSKK